MKMHHCLPVAAVLLLSGAWCHGADLAEQRARLRELPEMRRVLENPEANPVLRRTAFRNILKTPEAETAAVKSLSGRDVELRKAAVYYFASRRTAAAEKALIRAAGDEDAGVRLLAVLALRRNPSPESRELLKSMAGNETDPLVRKAALATPKLPSGGRRLLRDDPFWDHDIVKIDTVAIAENTLKFRLDPIADGLSKGYQEERFDYSGWEAVRFGDWCKLGHSGYRGTAWYRLRFMMPEKPEHNAVELFIPEVSGGAWVWLNGFFVGESGENTMDTRQLRFDITGEVNWNGTNELSVRVAGEGEVRGLLKPLLIEIFK